MTTTKTTTMKAKWFKSGVEMEAVQTVHHLDKSATGLRVVEMNWADGVTEVSLIKGHGMKSNFTTFSAGSFSA